MKILEEKKLPQSRVFFKVEIPLQTVRVFFDKSYKKLAYSLKIPGFRVGKAPKNLIKKEAGQEAVLKEVLDSMLPEIYFEIIQNKKLIPTQAPQVNLDEIPREDKNFIFIFEVDVIPQIEIPNLKKLFSKFKFKKGKIEVKEKDVQKVLESLQKDQALFKDKKEPAQKGDFAEIDFKAYFDGKIIEGGESQNHPLIIGEGIFIPGFEDNLLGMNVKEKKEFELVFPKDYHKKELASKKIKFETTLKTLKKVILPPLDDKFALKFGYKTILELKKAIKDSIIKEREKSQEKELEKAILDFLLENISFEIPKSLKDEEKENIFFQFKHSLIERKINFEDYLSKTGKKEEEIKEGFGEEAEKRVKIGLLLDVICKNEKIDVDEGEIPKEIEKIAKIWGKEAKDLKKDFEETGKIKEIYLKLKTEKVLDFLKNLTNI